jgi:TetR/AcrR family transcriptional regulator, cholesterol catabolism regulator
MPSVSPARSGASARRRVRTPRPQSRFDRRLSEILTHATDVFDEKGYAGASMRDLSRASGMSLAGLYYYFESKEKLLYLIQRHSFTTISDRLRTRLEGVTDPEARIRAFILNHLDYFLANQKAMKVLSHEDEVLKNGYGAEIAEIKREYVRTCIELMEQLKRAEGLDFSSRTAALSLFGMMNWIYTWYKPRVDGDAQKLGQQMSDIFLQGVCSGPGKAPKKGSRLSN